MIFKNECSEKSSSKTWKILVVEDDEGLNSLIRKNLERAGFETIGAFEGKSAIPLIGEDTLVILDYRLPDMDGIQVIEILSKSGFKAPFVVLTGQGDERTAVEMMKRGARDYLLKEASILDYLPEIISRVLNDIETETKLESALCRIKQSEENYRTLLLNLTEGVAVFDEKRRLIYANPSAETIFGTKSPDYIGKGLEEFISFEHIFNLESFFAESDSSEIHNIDLHIEPKNSANRDIIISVVKLLSNTKQLDGYIATFRDITERIQAQERINYLARLVDGVSDAIISTDADFKIASWNSAAERLYGWSLEEVLGKPIGEVLKTEYPESGQTELCEIFECEDEFREVIQTSKSGKKIFALPSVSFLRENGKDTSGMVVVYHDITDRRNAEWELKKSFEKLKKVFNSVVDIAGRIVEVRDPYTAGHERRVCKLAVAIAKKMKLSQDKIDAIRTSALVHDIGKIYVPSEILSKPGALTQQEFDLIKVHPKKGFEILEAVEFPWPVSAIVLQHHERLDGSGYPNGLKGNEILLEAKILAVADVVEAMASHRPYRPAPGVDAALDEVIQNKGSLFDPGIVDICVELISDNSFTF